MKHEIYVQISSGQGPEVCCWVVGKVFEKILEDCKKTNCQVSNVELSKSRLSDNYKSIKFILTGRDLESFTDKWEGVIKWIGQDPYRPNHKRKNWFVSVSTFSIPEKYQFDLNEVELKAVKASGPGGQHRNKTESGIRATHIPTGITINATEERSQEVNKVKALKRLKLKLIEKEAEEARKHKSNSWMQHNRLERGNPKRFFVGKKFSEKHSSK